MVGIDKIKMPYYRSHGNYCSETVMKTLLSLNAIDESITELIMKTKHQRYKVIWPVEIARAFFEIGTPFEYFVKDEFFNIHSRQKFIKYVNKCFGIFGERILNESNIDNIVDSVSILISNNQFRLMVPDISSVSSKLVENKKIIFLLNSDLYFKRDDQKHGHYVLLLEQTNDNFIYYDPGPKSYVVNGMIEKTRLFKERMDANFLDYGVIVV